MNLLIVSGLVIIAAWIYIFWLREWLDAHLQGTSYAWWHEQVEDVLWDKSRTILSARLYWVGGAVVAIHDTLAALFVSLDWTPVTTQIVNLAPEKLKPFVPLLLGIWMVLTGALFEYLRKVTTKPVGG